MSLAAFAKFGSNSPIEADNSDHKNWLGKVAQTKLRMIAKEFAEKKAEIGDGKTYVPAAQKEKIGEAARAALAEIEDLKIKTLAPLQQRHRQAQADFQNVSGLQIAKDDIVGYLREAETRTTLRELDESKRLQAFREAIENEDLLVVRAIVNAPKFAPLVNPKVVNAGEQAIVEKLHPGEAKAAKGADYLATVVAEDFEAVTTGIQTEGGIEPDFRQRIENLNQ